MIYNLTTHVCNNKAVETEPRLSPLENPKDGNEAIAKVKEAVKGIPKNSSVLVGGHPNYIILVTQIAKTMNFKVWLIDPTKESLYTAAYISRVDRYEIEKNQIREVESENE